MQASFEQARESARLVSVALALCVATYLAIVAAGFEVPVPSLAAARSGETVVARYTPAPAEHPHVSPVEAPQVVARPALKHRLAPSRVSSHTRESTTVVPQVGPTSSSPAPAATPTPVSPSAPAAPAPAAPVAATPTEPPTVPVVPVAPTLPVLPALPDTPPLPPLPTVEPPPLHVAVP